MVALLGGVRTGEHVEVGWIFIFMFFDYVKRNLNLCYFINILNPIEALLQWHLIIVVWRNVKMVKLYKKISL